MHGEFTRLAWLTMLGVLLAAGCGDARRRGDGDGAAGEVCGPSVCAAGSRCCDHCTGACVPNESGAFCPDDADPTRGCPAECRANGDCTPGQECLAPGESTSACGIPCREERLCESVGDCSDGSVCLEFVGTCCFAGDPLSSGCAAACTAVSCGADQTCDGDSGACVPTPCDAGYACATHTTCRPEMDGEAGHGCVRDACAGDGDCPGGACVKNQCYAMPGACVTPMAVP